MTSSRTMAAFAICFVAYLSLSAAAVRAAGPAAESTVSSPLPDAKASVSESVSTSQSGAGTALVWHDDYSDAMRQAKVEKNLMLIHFFRSSDQQRKEAGDADDSVVNIEKRLALPEIQQRLTTVFVLAKLPIDSAITVQGKTQRLLDHAAFSELHKGPGIAVIDLAHEKSEYFGYVVSVLPFTPGKYYRFRANHLNALVDLPKGTLTQRSMVLAVRIHPEHPASTNGQEDPILLSEATGHSNYQAQVKVQGHQGWGSRFERIIGKLLGRGTPGLPVEVVAESWPNQDLMDSCVDCVASWRQSDGHWSAVKAQQASYGYDIREGDNGIWYATGIFRPKQ